MAASLGGYHLQFKEQFSLAEPLAILKEPFCLLSEVGDTLEVPRRHLQTLNANWAKHHCGVDSESTLMHSLNAALIT